jgi:hypothetical protein
MFLQEEAATARQRCFSSNESTYNNRRTVGTDASVRSVPRIYRDKRQNKLAGCYSRRLAVLSRIVSSHYLATTSEETEDIMLYSCIDMYSV